MDECREVGIFCRNVSYGKRAKEELDKGDGTQFIIFPINDRDKLLGQRIDKAYVLDDVSYREILYLVQPCLKDRDDWGWKYLDEFIGNFEIDKFVDNTEI